MHRKVRLRTSRRCRSWVQSVDRYSRMRKIRGSKPRGCFASGADLELLEQGVDVVVDCRDLDVKLGRDLFVRQAPLDQRGDLSFARREGERPPIGSRIRALR